jgi:hypothetical protein
MYLYGMCFFHVNKKYRELNTVKKSKRYDTITIQMVNQIHLKKRRSRYETF